MESHFSNKKYAIHVLFSLLVVAFGFGLLWAGFRGVKIALNSTGTENSSNTASVNEYSDLPNKILSSKTLSIENNLSPSNSALTNSGIPTSSVANLLSLGFDASKEITIMIGGDVMLDRAVRRLANQYGYNSLFENVTPIFKKADITIINLEGPITNNTSRTLLANGKTSKELVFTFATTTAKALKDAGISAVSLANNHTTNFGTAGFKETKKWLDKADVKYFGDSWNSSSTEAIINKNNIPVAFVGYYAFESGFSRVLNTVKKLSAEGNFVIVMPHWGDEYATSSTEKMHSQARELANSGAGAILGAHPHVILDREWIGNTPVFYSLGNLLFDQYFSKRVMHGNLVEIRLYKDGSGTHIKNISVYDTSTASRRGIDVTSEAIDFSR